MPLPDQAETAADLRTLGRDANLHHATVVGCPLTNDQPIFLELSHLPAGRSRIHLG